jgi:flagellar operon protein
MNELLLPKVGPAISPEIRDAALPKGPDGPAFERLLRDKIGSSEGKTAPAPASALKFSAHALSRLKDRSIPMSADLLGRLEKAVDTASQKGAKESLILSSDAAFIVSVKNKTVITVVDRNQMSGNVFTNIDSTVVI